MSEPRVPEFGSIIDQGSGSFQIIAAQHANILPFPAAKLSDRSRKHTKRQCCGSGSAGSVCFWASFYHQARIMRNTLISTVLWLLFDFLSFLLNPISYNFYDFSQKSGFLYVQACSGLRPPWIRAVIKYRNPNSSFLRSGNKKNICDTWDMFTMSSHSPVFKMSAHLYHEILELDSWTASAKYKFGYPNTHTGSWPKMRQWQHFLPLPHLPIHPYPYSYPYPPPPPSAFSPAYRG